MFQQIYYNAATGPTPSPQTGGDLFTDFNPTYCFYDNTTPKAASEYVHLNQSTIPEPFDNSLNDIQSYLKEFSDNDNNDVDLPVSPFNPGQTEYVDGLSSLESDTNWFTELPLPSATVNSILCDKETKWAPQETEVAAVHNPAASPASAVAFSPSASSPASTSHSSYGGQSPSYPAQYPPTTPSPNGITYSPVTPSPSFNPYSTQVASFSPYSPVSPATSSSTALLSPDSSIVDPDTPALFDVQEYDDDGSDFTDFDFSTIECQPQSVEDLSVEVSSNASETPSVEVVQAELVAMPIRASTSFAGEVGGHKCEEKRLRKKQQNKDAAIRYRFVYNLNY